MTTTVTYESVTAALTTQVAEDSDAGRRAAAELLLGHDVWPRRGDFHRLATFTDADGTLRIGWSHAAQAFTDDQFGPCSTSEYAVLDLAVALATGRFRFNQLRGAHAAVVLRAMHTALPQARQANGGLGA